MGVPISQAWTVAKYVLGKRLRGVRRYPLVLMLEPLFRCNLACAGCGKIQHPPDVLRRNLSVEACLQAAAECGAPIVSLPGGEPLLHPQIDRIVDGLVRQRRFVYLCTNGLLLAEAIQQRRLLPDRRLALSVHLDGTAADHDRAVCRQGVYDQAVQAIHAARQAGFRVTTNTTLFGDCDVQQTRQLFDQLMELGVEAMMISPGYPYPKAPDQQNFLRREQTTALFRQLLAGRKAKGWRFNQTPLFLEFLQGNWQLPCTPWGNPTYNLFGWQRPCYLLDEGYCDSFQELMETTDWDRYGQQSGNPKCRDCMVHCGYEPSAVQAALTSWRGMWATARHMR